MSRRWNRMETWLALFVLGVAVIILGVGGLWVYMEATATPLHPDPDGVPSAASADPSRRWSEPAERARQIVRVALSEQNLPGLSVAVGVDGEIAWAEGFGWADVEHQARVKPETNFRMGNASVVLTSAAVGVLIDKGRVKLDDEIQGYVPEFPKKQWPVTLRQVMGHVAGIGSDGGDEGPLFGEHCDRPVEALKAFADEALRFEPDTQYRFSNFGFILVSAAIETAAQEPFLRFIRKEIFEPLHMERTMLDTVGPIDDRATSYFPKFAADPHYGNDLMREVDYSCYSGASAFVSTPSDLVRFAMAINGGKLLQPATLQSLQTAQRLRSGGDTGYGLGWDLEPVTLAGKPAQAIGHDGELLGGMSGSLMTFRKRGIAVSVLTNTSYAKTADVALKIAEVFAQPVKP